MYKELTIERMAEIVATHQEIGGESREFKIHCGPAFKDLFEKALQIEVLKMAIYNIRDRGGFNRAEATNLVTMLKSPDEENYEVAKAIIKNKEKIWL